MKRTRNKNHLCQMIGAMLLFLILNIPFRLIMDILPYTEVRPSNMVPPVLGILWGIWGALGTALGNLIVDIQISKSSMNIWLPGFFINFLYEYLPYKMWYNFGKKQEKKIEAPTMGTTNEILKYCGIIMADSVVVTILLTLTFQFADMEVTASNIGFLFFNNFDFAILLGIPTLILTAGIRLHREGRKLSIGSRAVGGFMMLSVIFITVLGIFTERLLHANSAYDEVARWNYIYWTLGIGIHILFAGSLLFLRYVEKNITKPLELLKNHMQIFAETDHRLETGSTSIGEFCKTICTGDELQVLSEAFLKMTEDIQMYVKNLERITIEKERIGTELAVASNIQNDMLPMVFPAFPDKKQFQIYAMIDPAKEVGGDFYDFFLVDERHLGIVMADVAGKGVPAALFMVIAKTLIQNQAKQMTEPEQIFYHVNQQLCTQNKSGMFVTAWLGILDIDTGKLCYTNAGHTRPFIYTEGNKFNWFTDIGSGFVLGIIEEKTFPYGEYYMQNGDVLFLYTDGITEAHNKKEELYGEERLLASLNQCRKKSLKELLDTIKKEVEQFSEEREQFDDMTMLALKYEGNRI